MHSVHMEVLLSVDWFYHQEIDVIIWNGKFIIWWGDGGSCYQMGL